MIPQYSMVITVVSGTILGNNLFTNHCFIQSGSVIKSCVRLFNLGIFCFMSSNFHSILAEGWRLLDFVWPTSNIGPHLSIFGITFMILGRLELNPLHQNTITSHILSTKLIYISTWLCLDDLASPFRGFRIKKDLTVISCNQSLLLQSNFIIINIHSFSLVRILWTYKPFWGF